MEVFVYLIDLPNSIREYVTPCLDGYTIYINKDLTSEEQEKAYDHAMWHIRNKDFDKHDVQQIEYCAHHMI